jgi:mono/diheme cytochrome c family protein
MAAVVLAALWPVGTLQAADAPSVQEELAQIRQELALLRKQSVARPGGEIYRVACATCHGIRGDGRGPSALRFRQRPTDFTKGVYKLRSTGAKLPAAGDLERTVREGMPGTEMVPFGGMLSEDSIRLVAAYVRTFSKAFDDPAALALAEQKRIAIPAQRPAPASDASIAKGKEVYTARCQDCHGERGEGDDRAKDEWGFPLHMLDLRLGYYKSGRQEADLYRTVLTGMNGTDMGAYAAEVSPEDTWAVVDYIRSLGEKSGGLSRMVGWLLSDRPSGFDYGSY